MDGKEKRNMKKRDVWRNESVRSEGKVNKGKACRGNGRGIAMAERKKEKKGI